MAPASRSTQRGFIDVDDHCRTGAAKVWAVGDCVRGPMLAHKAKEEGVMAADLIAGRYGHVNYDAVPSVIYTASGDRLGGADRGAGEGQRAHREDRAVPVHRQRPRACDGGDRRASRAIVADADTDEMLGVHIIGPMAGELIAEAVPGDGVLREQRGPAAHDACAPDPVGSGA